MKIFGLGSLDVIWKISVLILLIVLIKELPREVTVQSGRIRIDQGYYDDLSVSLKKNQEILTKPSANNASYEYRTIISPWPDAMDELKKLGHEGWELVSVVHVEENYVYCYLKRVKKGF
jgi:FMN phosphatase YigB (HAD superfamily)